MTSGCLCQPLCTPFTLSSSLWQSLPSLKRPVNEDDGSSPSKLDSSVSISVCQIIMSFCCSLNFSVGFSDDLSDMFLFQIFSKSWKLKISSSDCCGSIRLHVSLGTHTDLWPVLLACCWGVWSVSTNQQQSLWYLSSKTSTQLSGSRFLVLSHLSKVPRGKNCVSTCLVLPYLKVR